MFNARDINNYIKFEAVVLIDHVKVITCSMNESEMDNRGSNSIISVAYTSPLDLGSSMYVTNILVEKEQRVDGS